MQIDEIDESGVAVPSFEYNHLILQLLLHVCGQLPLVSHLRRNAHRNSRGVQRARELLSVVEFAHDLLVHYHIERRRGKAECLAEHTPGAATVLTLDRAREGQIAATHHDWE